MIWISRIVQICGSCSGTRNDKGTSNKWGTAIMKKISSLEFCKEQFSYISEMSQHHRQIWKQLDQIVLTYLSVTIAFCRGFPVAQLVKNLPAKAGDTKDIGLIPGLGWSPGERNDHLFQYSCLENSMDRGVWQATATGVTMYQTWLSVHACVHTHTDTHTHTHTVPGARCENVDK